MGLDLSIGAAWRYVYASAAGTSHLRSDLPCQDASAVRELVIAGADPVLVLVAADGAGSASRAEAGSKLMRDTILELVLAWVQDHGGPDNLSEEIVREWFRSRIRKVIMDQAEAVGARLRDFATTVLCAIAGGSTTICFQVGDGAIVIAKAGEYEAVFWPQSGEYVNTTHFATDDDAPDRLMFGLLDCTVSEIALFTDGLQMLALDFAAKAVHQPFFAPMFTRLRTEPPGESPLSTALEEFLNSDRVNSRTDDDKTLLLATRHP